MTKKWLLFRYKKSVLCVYSFNIQSLVFEPQSHEGHRVYLFFLYDLQYQKPKKNYKFLITKTELKLSVCSVSPMFAKKIK